MKGGRTKRFTMKDDGEEGIYEGEFNEKGERHGKGIMHDIDSDTVYEGDWKNDKMDGNGKFTYGKKSGYKGVSYEGEFKDNDFSGHGNYIDQKLAYRGEFVNNKKHGMGYVTTTGVMGRCVMYVEFKDDEFIKGTGTRCYKDVKEEGEFKDDILVKGKRHYTSGQIEEGDFVNGRIRNGKKTWPDDQVYVGTYNENGDMHGEGRFVGRYKYDGEYQNGKRNGFGVFTYPDGSVYEGQFKNDKMDGMGKLTLANGTTKTGRFHDNQPYPDVVVFNPAQNSIFTELGPAGRVFSRTSKRRPSRK